MEKQFLSIIHQLAQDSDEGKREVNETTPKIMTFDNLKRITRPQCRLGIQLELNSIPKLRHRQKQEEYNAASSLQRDCEGRNCTEIWLWRWAISLWNSQLYYNYCMHVKQLLKNQLITSEFQSVDLKAHTELGIVHVIINLMVPRNGTIIKLVHKNIRTLIKIMFYMFEKVEKNIEHVMQRIGK